LAAEYMQDLPGSTKKLVSQLYFMYFAHMKTRLLYLLFICLISTAGCENTDIDLVTDAGIDAYKAATLSDEDVKILAVKASRKSDTNNRLAPHENTYSKRLNGLVSNHYQADGYTFNFKVYLSDKVNAFAMADGTIRIYSGLMDMLNDQELLFVIGHEMGHVVKKHIKKKIMLAYAGSALRKGIASQNNDAGTLARSALGGLLESLINAQFSQQEEREADDYGIAFLYKEGYDIKGAISALKKLATLGSNHSFLSSHPAPLARAERMEGKIGPDGLIETPTWAERIIVLFQEFISWVKSFF